MQMLSDDDVNLRDLSEEELALAWDLWFDLAQTTNDDDPAYTHGVFQTARIPDTPITSSSGGQARSSTPPDHHREAPTWR